MKKLKNHILCATTASLLGFAALMPVGAQPSPDTAPPAAAPPAPEIAIKNMGAPAIVQPPISSPPATPYGLGVAWTQGDLVNRSTLVLLAVMSLASWYIMLAKLLEQNRQNLQARAARASLAGANSLDKGASALTKDNPFRFIVDSALEAYRKHDHLAGQVDIGSWLSQDIVRTVSTLQMRMQTGLAVLATVGSTAPFVGLFGTVWGIYNALVTIGTTGQASIDKVAGPVGEALIMTALGLAVAVPAVLGYNWLVRRNRLAMHSVKGFGSDLHTLLLIEIEKGRRSSVASRNPS